MWPIDMAAWLCASGECDDSCVSSAMCPPTWRRPSAARGSECPAPPRMLHMAVRHIRCTCSSLLKRSIPSCARAPESARGATADGTKETLAMAERAHCWTCCRCDPSSAVSSTTPGSAATIGRYRSSAANCATACTAWYDVSVSACSKLTSGGSPPMLNTDSRSDGLASIEATAPAAGALASALDEESSITMCGSTDARCSMCIGMAFEEHRLPKVIAAYDLSSWFGCSSNSSKGSTQPLSTIAAACCFAELSCDKADRACSCDRVLFESSCSASITMPPLSKSCSELLTSPGQSSATSDPAMLLTLGCSCDISWMR
mmetsp:Transcript_11014/g.24617  ORF Transcript_11014/g.24617 Transcript_11014/m.24617 type:complete len:317 (-) Transcript_11014:1861-2811(-)